MNGIEKKIVLGRLASGQTKNGDNWYRVDYLDLALGVACQDYISAESFKQIASKKLPIGTTCVGVFTSNERRILVIDGIK